MTIRHLDYLFNPKTVALIGASNKAHSVGATVLHNLVSGGFAGTLYPVNPNYQTLADLKTYPRVADLPSEADLAIICTPAQTVPALIQQLGACGTKAAIVISAARGNSGDAQAKALVQAMLDAAKPYQLRVLGPNSMGLLVPALGLNASFSQRSALPGKLAFVSQSGAMVTGVLDWASSRGIGFSKFISLGQGADVDFGDVLDYLASDGDTQAILLYIEGIQRARKFMSAARLAARSKPVIVVKAGSAAEGARAATLHSGAVAGNDAIYDAAIRRAGMLRVFSTEQLFNAVETLANARPFVGERLTIMTNGGGPGVMATDELIASGGSLATLTPRARAQLDAILPAGWSKGNPVDIIGDAPTQRYLQTLAVLLDDPQSDALLFIHAPTAIVGSTEIANALLPLLRQTQRTVLACWLGGDGVAQARQLFAQAGIACYDTPEQAVRGFMQIVDYRRNQNLLMQVPASLSDQFTPDTGSAQAVINHAIAAGQSLLTEPQAKAVLAAYGIPVVAAQLADSIAAAVKAAQQIGFPVALKLLSPSVRQASDVGGIALDLATMAAVRTAALAMSKRLRLLRPDAAAPAFSIRAMVPRNGAHKLSISVTTDPLFGPTIRFGQGGRVIQVNANSAVGLPPLNAVLALDLVCRAGVDKLVAGSRNRAPANIDAICSSLIQVAHLVSDLAQVIELQINPLLADANGVLALDARIKVTAASSVAAALDRLAIQPYPKELEQTITWQSATLMLRPIRPEDGAAHLRFFAALDPQDVRLRLFSFMRQLSASQLARWTQIDYDREMAFIASRALADGNFETLGVARAIIYDDNITAEFAIVVRSDCKGKGLGTILMRKLIDYCRGRGLQRLVGDALRENRGMLEMIKRLGFETAGSTEPHALSLQLSLRDVGRDRAVVG